MKGKFLGLFLLTAFLLSLSLASAINFTQNETSKNVTLSSQWAGTITATSQGSMTDEAGQAIIVTPTVINNQTVNIAVSIPNYANLKTGKLYSGVTVVISNTTNTQNESVYLVRTFCDNGPINTSSLTLKVDITNNGEGEDDNNWIILDNIEIEVKFENDKTDLDDVNIELGLFDKASGDNVADDLIWLSNDEEKVDVGNVDKGEDAENVFEFEVSTDIEAGDYLLMIKAYTDNGDVCLDSSDLTGTYYEEISIERESNDERQIVLEDITVEPSSSICNGEVLVTANAFNIGKKDQDAVKVVLYNKELDLDMEYVLTNFDTDDNAKIIEFAFTVPKNATEKTYVLDLYSMYDYDEDDDEEGNYPDSAFDEISETFKTDLEVKGNCIGSQTGNASITARLSEDTPRAVIGKQVIIEATIKNTGTNSTTYTVEVTGNSAWSTVADIEPKTFTLGAGEEKKVRIYLDISEDAEEGDKLLTIKATYGSQATIQNANLTLEKGLTAQALLDHLKKNWYIYVIALVNLIIIIAIIVVIAKMMAAKAAA